MYALGLYIDGHLLKMALMRREKNQIDVEMVRSFDLKDTSDALSLLSPILAQKKALIATGLDAWEVLLREIPLKLKRKREILSVLPFQSESQIPYPLEDAILVPFLPTTGKELSEVTLLATKKEALSEHLKKMASLQVDPDWVSAIPAALWRYAKSYLSPASSLFHLGIEKSCYLSFSNEKLIFSQTLSLGLKNFICALQEDAPEKTFDDLDLSSLDPEEFPRLVEVLEKFNREWERILAFFEKKGLTKEFSFLGDIPFGLRLFLEKGIKGEKGDHPSYAIPIGLALDAIYQDEHSVQLRQSVYATPRLFTKRLKTLALCLSSLGMLTFATWGSTHFFLKSKEKILIQRAESYQDKKLENNRAALIDSVRSWSKSLSGQKVPFPYQLTTPQVSALLAWISSHPQLSKPGIEIKRIHYVLVKYPTLNKSNQPYQAKVELEFLTSSPTLAREFHDSLLKGEGLVNAKQEISWNVHENKYSTTFLLKDSKL